MEMKGQINVLILLNPGENTVTYLVGGQVDTSAGLEVPEDAKNSLLLPVTYICDLMVNSLQTLRQNIQIFVAD